jgi:CheY-like chemotaxis protein
MGRNPMRDAFPPASPRTLVGRMRKTRTVLVVDDNPVHRYAMNRILSTAGFKVAEAWNGPAALEAAPAADAVVLDVFMPGMDGWQVCRSLRANAATKSVPIVFFSAAYGDEARAECERAGGDAYYPSPVWPDELVGRLTSLMGIVRFCAQPPCASFSPSARLDAKSAELTRRWLTSRGARRQGSVGLSTTAPGDGLASIRICCTGAHRIAARRIAT